MRHGHEFIRVMGGIVIFLAVVCVLVIGIGGILLMKRGKPAPEEK